MEYYAGGAFAPPVSVFKNILANVQLDIFSEIYEYFISKLALAEAQGCGEFFTLSTVARYMVEVLRPILLYCEENGQ